MNDGTSLGISSIIRILTLKITTFKQQVAKGVHSAWYPCKILKSLMCSMFIEGLIVSQHTSYLVLTIAKGKRQNT